MFLKSLQLFKKIHLPSFRFASIGKYQSYNSIVHTEENLPQEDRYNIKYLERNEIEARIYKILQHFDYLVNSKELKWTDDFEKKLKMDSLEQTALLTSVEQEFNIVFEDRVFDNFKNLEEVIRFIQGDNLAF